MSADDRAVEVKVLRDVYAFLWMVARPETIVGR